LRSDQDFMSTTSQHSIVRSVQLSAEVVYLY
jgi:hypothetical protein